MSVDGKMEGFSPECTGLYYQLASKLGCDTLLFGSDTLLTSEDSPEGIHPKDKAEEPLPTTTGKRSGLLVVPDSRGRVRNWYTHFVGIGARAAVALVSHATPRAYLDYLAKRNIPYIETGDDHVDYRVAFEELSSHYNTKAIRTDSGGLLNNILLQQRLVTELSLLVSPELVGKDARSLFRTLILPETICLQLLSCKQVQENYVWLRYGIQV
jgi:2,5-diamino-6-(ribosylamino)-4(3H)-pyrimidinone 5'-phosphate reductase